MMIELDPIGDSAGGYGVNATQAVTSWAAFRITPATPSRVFAGATTYFYNFASRAAFDAALAGADLNPPPPLAQLQAAALLKIDADVDAIYAAALGQRQSEYALAESEAAAYKAAGYPATPVPSSVQSWATAKVQTATWAANDILTTASGWRGAQASIRAGRLARKEGARAATSPAALDTVMASWAGFVTAMRGALGL